MSVTIVSRTTRRVIAEFDPDTLRGANLRNANLFGADLIGADLRRADLGCANLGNANLRGANLRGANLSGANLSAANLSAANLRVSDLRGANLCAVNLSGADLREANLRGANLCAVNLRGANLREANLCDANLSGADLREAYLCKTDLRGANLSGADLRGAITDHFVSDMCSILPEGNLIVWKSLRDGVLAKLSIPAEAKRSNSTGRKCRSEYADVLQIVGGDGIVGKSKHDEYFLYRVGERVYCDKWDDDRWNECSGGIHFFITQEEARLYEC